MDCPQYGFKSLANDCKLLCWLQLLPPIGYLCQPATSYTNKYTNISINKASPFSPLGWQTPP